MKIERFEDIKAWQEARVLAKMIYAAVDSARHFDSDHRLRDQIQGAVVSIMSNLTEGFSRRSTKEFFQFLFIAKGSAAEVESQLYVALDQGYMNEEQSDELYTKADEVARLISGFTRYLLDKDGFQEPKEPIKLEQLNKLEKLEELR